MNNSLLSNGLYSSQSVIILKEDKISLNSEWIRKLLKRLISK